MEKEYTVYFEGKIVVEADHENNARSEAQSFLEEELADLDATFNIKTVDEGECIYCGGEGEVATDEDDGEGHIMRGVGTQKCVCQH